MAKRRGRMRHAAALTAGVLAVCGSLLLALVVPSAAGAAAPVTSVRPKDAVVTGKCTLRQLSTNPTNNTRQVRLTAQAHPTTYTGYFNNAYTQMFCSVFDTSGNLLVAYNPYANGATLRTQSITPVVPLLSSYVLCGQAWVIQNNGSTFFTAQVCA